MSDVSNRSDGRKLPRRQRSIYQIHYGLEPRRGSVMASPLPLRRFTRQVAGHSGDVAGGKYTGLLQCSDGTILKPILKESQKREAEFYERITSSNRPDLVQLRKFMPKYYGVRKFTYNGFEQDYIMLEDLTDGMLEPCVMDLKIGRITYDPYASVDKIKREESKYTRCKQQYGFCIPGYQVYRVGGPRDGELVRAGKEQGKILCGEQVVTVIRSFLNASAGAACRVLLLQLLAALWELQRCISRAGVLLRSSSLLLVYDASALRACCGDSSVARCRPPRLARRRAVPSVFPSGGSSFSSQLSQLSPVYPRLGASPPVSPRTPSPPVLSSWSEALARLATSHSFDNNYQEKLSRMKLEYRARLDRLANWSGERHPCGSLRVVDFAHAFIQDEGNMRVDDNFKDGLDSLADILEALLKDTDDLLS
ncbi:inositol polyphosphate multikinase isoform X1 [Danaus plexippus]|uniref:inositol polyphosphate multikinase isoform X1 n=2 Tax=Danaus plexippus TaxID=13037 RepID=UPI002AB203E6|nr:inositol polyphosphate multikinase isoform X1 [Danaus plexippus]XP_032518985.2 inositol polyphosphate multikinase isoform X1 [Danaus plexippus]XP_032518986.2 inositol polyphosphate multikinase isoform X1 [Danaus plexippus]XP_061379185.1 inositol polyphosphate multikinase isoform X1 [Danaus plexippus]